MPGTRCTVGACTNSRAKAKKSGNYGISFYGFPKDKKLREIWVQRCGRGGKWNPDSCHVCSKHFTEEDYERNLQAELLNLPAKRKLKSTGEYNFAFICQKLEIQ